MVDCVGNLQRMRRELERMDISLAEGEMANIILSNAVGVYPSIPNEHTQRVPRLRGSYDKDQRVQDAVNSLLIAERTAQHQYTRNARDDGRGIQLHVGMVTCQTLSRDNSSQPCHNHQQCNGKRRNTGNAGGRGGATKKRRSDEASRKIREEIAEQKHISKCKSRHQRGHWWKAYPKRNSTDTSKI